ncbi:MAG: ParB/RepB/Spo0J family partition protein [Chitinophagaceae bacterium]|nr:ParB/RepB/Spo0J family partition protein [Chitinophagaceae bacterium]
MSEIIPSKKKTGLGRGLSALLSDNPTPVEHVQSIVSINEIDIQFLETNPYQPRKDFNKDALQELSESIKVHGIIQPITVRKISDTSYQIISGERRVQASKIAGLTKIPAYIRSANDQEMLEMALIENIQRENLNSIEIALSYQRLITECNLKQEELGERVGKNRATVTNYLRLLKLPPDIQAALRDNTISMGHARSIVSVENADLQLNIFHRIVKEDLSVRNVEEIVRSISEFKKEKNNPQKETTHSMLSPEIRKWQNTLSSHFGSKIIIKADEKHKGEIKIPFYSQEDLNRILEILNIDN